MPALHWQVGIALLLAAGAGTLIDPQPDFVTGCAFVDKLFLNALKMIVVPLIVSAIIRGIVSVTDADGLGRMGLKTLGYYLGTRLCAILIGLFYVN